MNNQSLYMENYGNGNIISRDRDRDYESRNLTSHITPSQPQSFQNPHRDVEFIPGSNSSLYTGPVGNGYYGNNNSAYSGNINNNQSFSNNQMRYDDGNPYARMGNFSSGQMSRSGKNLGSNSPTPNIISEPSQQSQQYRHARRIYLGGIPPNYADEEALKNFLNHVISKGLGEENDHSYVVSIYINQKKCFAFVELKSVELATACLDLDGIIYKKVILKVLRAKEYQPELLPPSFLVKSVRFDLTSFAFGCPATPVYNPVSTETKDFQDAKLDSIIQFSNLSAVARGSVVVVGFPFDDNAIPGRGKTITPQGMMSRGMPLPVGSSIAPKSFRNSVHKSKYGIVDNPEYAIDLSVTKMFDVGDVLGGKNSEETKLNLTATVTELIARGGIPFVIGGSVEQVYYNAMGLVAGINSTNVGVLCISAQLDSRLLDDPKFCPPKVAQPGPPSCEGRYIRFAAQGSQCTSEVAQYIGDRGGQVIWYGKHLRNPASKSTAAYQFKKVLSSLTMPSATGPNRPVYVSLDVGAMSAAAVPQVYTSNSPVGLTVDEVLDMAMIAGANPNVVLFDVVEFVPTAEDSRYNLFLAELYYKFCLGVASRAYIQAPETLNSGYISPPASSINTATTFEESKSLSNSSMSSLAKLSLKQPISATSSLSSSAPEFPAPADPFIMQQSGSGKHQGRFGSSLPASLSQPYNNFSSNLSVASGQSDDLAAGDLSGSYSGYFDNNAPQLDMGGNGYFSSSFGAPSAAGIGRGVANNPSKNVIDPSSAYLGHGFNSGSNLPSPSSATSFSNLSGKHKSQSGSGQMMFSNFGMDQNNSAVGIGLMNPYSDGMGMGDSVFNPPQYDGTDPRRYNLPGINVPDPSVGIVSDMSPPSAYPGATVGSFYGHKIRNETQPPALSEDVDTAEIAVNETNEG